MSTIPPSQSYIDEKQFYVSHYIAGALSGIAGLVVGHPLDTSKVRMQTTAQGSAQQWGGMFSVLWGTMKNEGIRGLYRGLGAPLAGEAAISTIEFGLYGTLQRLTEQSSFWYTPFINGAVVGGLSSIFTAPVELIKIRLQVQTEKRSFQQYKGPVDMIAKIWRTERSSLIRGLPVTWIRDIPSFAIYFGSYELIKKYAAGEDGTMRPWTQIAAGATSGSLSWIPVYPIDVLKTRLQDDRVQRYQGLIDCYRQVVRQEGYRALGRGFVPSIIRSMPVNATVFYVYEYTRRLFDNLLGRNGFS